LCSENSGFLGIYSVKKQEKKVKNQNSCSKGIYFIKNIMISKISASKAAISESWDVVKEIRSMLISEHCKNCPNT
jgi:hypothetical protein